MDSKIALDKIIKGTRAHFYKPIQIAEILHSYRMNGGFEISDLESYRNLSKKWRDQISNRLVGRISTSSQKFQDNLFENNAMPPRYLEELANYNNDHNGIVEAYVYKIFQQKLVMVKEIEEYIKSSSSESFSLKKLLDLFIKKPGLKRSIDKVYEITVYALFTTIVRALKAEISIELKNPDEEIKNDFNDFIKAVIGLKEGVDKVSFPAYLYRVGVTNAADRGLDMYSNFGPIIQVKHLTLTAELVEDITEGLSSDHVIIVCLDCEKVIINNLLIQLGLNEKVQGIITLLDLERWYGICLSDKYRNNLAKNLLNDLHREFQSEFPSGDEIQPFINERKYDTISLDGDWKLD